MKLIIEKHEKAIREGVSDLLWEVWNELDDLVNDIDDDILTTSDISKRLVEIMDGICF